MKGFAPRLALKQRRNAIRKSPINVHLSDRLLAVCGIAIHQLRSSLYVVALKELNAGAESGGGSGSGDDSSGNDSNVMNSEAAKPSDEETSIGENKVT